MPNNAIEQLERLETIIEKYSDIITDNMKNIRREFAVISSQQLRKKISEEDEKGRLLTLGIIGTVNAGKSSLLNSIFFDGRSILPKAATPMTASLAVLSYGETFSATVEYFTSSDIAAIKKEHDAYQTRWQPLFETNKKEREKLAKEHGIPVTPEEIEVKAKKAAHREMKESSDYASYDQYERMLKTGNDFENICAHPLHKLNASGLDELMSQMNDYVGSTGKLMPFTKSVEIQLPCESLRNIRVVDTPGINDPVRSREARTEEYLKECDAVLVISRAEQFITSGDMSLMDRISTREGIRELYLVASQVDNLLYGKEVKAAAGNVLSRAVENIRNDLTKQALKNLKDLAEKHPETTGQFEQLLKDGKERVLVTSALCNALYVNFHDRQKWDEDMTYVWSLLKENYGDSFDEGESGKACLNLLSNIETVKEKIDLTRSKKDQIIAQHKADYLDQQMGSILKFREELKKAIIEKQKSVREGDIQKLQAEKKSMEKRYYRGADSIDAVYDECFDVFRQKAKSAATSGIKNVFRNSETGILDSMEEETETWQEKKKGFTNWLARVFTGKGYEEKSETHQTIRPGAVESQLAALVNDLRLKAETALEDAKDTWKQTLPRRVVEEYQKVFSDDVTDDTDMLRYALRNVLNSMDIPPFTLSSHAYKGSYSGTLYDEDAYNFLDSIRFYLTELQRQYLDEVNSILGVIEDTIKDKKISSLLFENIKKTIEELESSIKNKALILDRLEKCVFELNEVN
jgi:predicted GTPase